MVALQRIFSIVRRLLLCLAVAVACFSYSVAPQSANPARDSAIILEIDGAIGPASASYVHDGLQQARAQGAELIILKLDTPGGLDTSMREIIQDILAMPVPVVTYVHPSGARAASAGTYILYASHLAAMTPGTNLGAATPIQLGGSPAQPEKGDDGGKPSAPKNAGERKAVNDAVGYIRSLAELRGRNADWAEAAVREGASLSADAAIQQRVVDIVAEDLSSLLQQLDGRSISIAGAKRSLNTSDMALIEIEPDWLTQVLATITNPNIALILMMVGIYGLFFEFMNPSTFISGVIGAISLLLGLYALAVLPVDFVGVALILLGLALMAGEAFAPSFGILGIGGLASFVFGAAILFDTDVPAFKVDWSIIAALAVFSAGLMTAVARLGIQSRRGAVETGLQEMIGARGRVLDWNEGAGHVFVRSERWNAVGPHSLQAGEGVAVLSVNGLTLEVAQTAAHESRSLGGDDGQPEQP
jgi:membrane-bound serine protease (ClpP class)